ncbi:MAG: Nif3-like dinuclear metal center hexameric protein [Bacteroidota bacterium]|nr:Nif3-like dinuclear metal center hexameric protein [Bacteroidota bacterium]
MNINKLTHFIESTAPPSLQESYDNAGLIVGNPKQEVKGVLISLDMTEEVIDEAKNKGANVILAHHPIIFKGLKQLTGKNYVERVVIKAIKEDIALYAAHTNLDNIAGGVNGKIADLLDLEQRKILSPLKNRLKKIVTFVPKKYGNRVRNALFNAGAGNIGNYDNCSFNTPGEGTFRAGEATHPFVGEKGKLHREQELRIESVFPDFKAKEVIKALLNSHPYEEAAYDIYPIDNRYEKAGAGIVGELKEPVDTLHFLKKIKNIFESGAIRYTKINTPKIKRVALCGGSGSFLLKEAIRAQADIYISADFKYHEFFDAEKNIIIADVGHYESEQFTKNLFYELVTKKFPNFACSISEINTNPINYL